MTDEGREQTRCPRRDPRGHRCELSAGHVGDHQRQPAVLTWSEWRGGDATEGRGEMLECLECGDERTENRLNPIDWGVGLGLCCCSAEVHVTPHELDSVQAQRDGARENAAHWRFHADQYVRLLAECEQVLGRASDADVSSFEQLTALADEARDLGGRLAVLQVTENAARLDGQQP